MAADLVPAPSPETKKKLKAAVTRIARLKAQGAEVLYDLGVVLREVQDEALWQASGHGSYTAWLEDGVEVSRTTAHKAVLVTRHFNREIAQRYGLDKLYWGLRYLELTRADEQPGDLIAADLRLRGDDGRYTRVPFHTATLRQIQEAVQLQAALPAPQTRAEPDLAARLDRLAAGLPAVPRGLAAAKRRVETLRAKDGSVALTFRQIPATPTDLRAFIALLQQTLLDDEA